eukprot:1229415-Rhodomonas_salina.1
MLSQHPAPPPPPLPLPVAQRSGCAERSKEGVHATGTKAKKTGSVESGGEASEYASKRVVYVSNLSNRAPARPACAGIAAHSLSHCERARFMHT